MCMVGAMGVLAVAMTLLVCQIVPGLGGVVTKEDYRAYLVRNGKSLDRLQDPRRFEAYQRTAEFVASHESSSYRVGMNEVADWLPHEIPGTATSTASSASILRSPWDSPHSADFSAGEGTTGLSLRGGVKKGQMQNVLNGIVDVNEQGHEGAHVGGLSRDKIIVITSGRDKKKIKDAKRYLAARGWGGSLSGFFGYRGNNDDVSGDDGAKSDGSQGINWASHNNPYNVSIVGEVANQGACGACWSFVAASAVEASVYKASKIHLRLSTQELVDCDRTFNRGCEGGNPIYAFEYIMKYGLTNQHSYPYDERQHAMCRRAQYVSRATIKSYLRLPPNNIELIKQFLHLGPVATGICGTNSSFLYYTGGLYDPPECCQTQNHAVLIVGYGVDPDTQREYLVIKNSWGVYWGEGGFMRLAAYPPTPVPIDSSYSSDSSGRPYSAHTAPDEIVPEAGTCGVAVGPSLPTDGVLIPLYSKQGSSKEDGGSGGDGDGKSDKDKHPVAVDDDSYTDDGTATAGDDDAYAPPSPFWRAWNGLYFWYELNKTNHLFFFALSLFLCSCGLCLSTLYEDCCNSGGISGGAGIGRETGDIREPLNPSGRGSSGGARQAPKSPRSVRHVSHIR